MKKLYMKQKVFSWRSRFTIKDEYEQDLFCVEGEFFTMGKKLHVNDAHGTEVALIQQKAFSFRPRFFVYIQGQYSAEIVKEYTFLHPRYTILGLDWEIEGDFWAHEYNFTKQGEPVVRVCKEWISWGDSYAVTIEHEEDTIAAIAVVLAIDCAMGRQAAAASAAT